MMTSTALLTDMYELTMLQAALNDGTAHKKSVFELFARKLPEGRRYGVVAGTERAIEAVMDFTFDEKSIAFLRRLGLQENTLDYLADYRFTGTISGYREGELYFPYSPILRVEGTFGEAVVLETVLLSIFNHDSAIASAASRMVAAARGIPLIEMGSRRTHEKAAVDAARAAYLTGFMGTSNLEASLEYGVPALGTSAHAFTLAHGDEKDAFRNQVEALGESTTLLVDTYDIPQGIRNAVEVAGTELGGIRIDSGDFYDEATHARQQLDELGAEKTKIVLSSDMDEFVIDEIIERQAPVDSIGVGTRLVTGSGHPTASMVYKLVSIERDGHMIPVAKKSSGKKSIGGAKTARRHYENGVAVTEIIDREGETVYGEDEDLRVPYIVQGEKQGVPSLEQSRAFHARRMDTLTTEQKSIQAGSPALDSIVEGESNGK